MDALGINLFSLIVYIILFAIIYLLLEKYLLPGLRKSIGDRKKLIADNVKKAEQLIEEEKKLQERMAIKEKGLLAEAKKRAEEIIANGEAEVNTIVKAAKTKADNMLADAKSSVVAKEEKITADFNNKLRASIVEVFGSYFGGSDKIDQAKLAKALESIK